MTTNEGSGGEDVRAIRANTIALVRKMFQMPVELGSEICTQHLKENPGCNNCDSFPGCSLVFTVLNWIAERTGRDYSKDKLDGYMKGLFDGYTLGVTGAPQTKPDSGETT